MKDTCKTAGTNSAPLAAQRRVFGVIPSQMIWGVLACCFVFLSSQLSYAQGPACIPATTGAAASTNTVLILGTTVPNGCSSLEATRAQLSGFDVEIADHTAWLAKSTANFATYKAIVLGDPSNPTCATDPTPVLDDAVSTTGTWGPAITGPVAIVGTDPADHVFAGSNPPFPANLTQNAIALAASSSGHPGAYISLSCYYYASGADTPVPVLSPFGSFTVQGQGAGCPNSSTIVAPANPLVTTPNAITSAGLSGWTCSTHEAFNSFPSTFTPVVQSNDLNLPYIIATASQTVTEPLSQTTTVFLFTTPGAVTQQTIDYTNSGATFTGVTMQVTLRQISDFDANSEFQRLVQGTDFQGSQCLHRNLGNGNFACAGTVVLCTTSTSSTPLGTNCPQAVLTGLIGVTDKYATDPNVFVDPSQVPNPGYLAASDDALSCAPTDLGCKGVTNIFSALKNDCCTTSGTTKTFNSFFVPVAGVLQPTYSFTGFFQPVDNPPTYNVVKAGGGVPVKFSLGGNFGLNIFATGYPKSSPITCSSTDLQDAIETTVTAGQSSLSFDPTSLQYTYVWKTLTGPGWTAGTCRQLQLKFTDGTSEYANFKFK